MPWEDRDDELYYEHRRMGLTDAKGLWPAGRREIGR